MVDDAVDLSPMEAASTPATRRTRGRGQVSPREERRRQLQELSRGHLLDAAERVFAEKGFESAAVREIAELAELSVGSVYQLFENKKAIFRAVFERRNEEGLAVLTAALAGVDSPVEQLHRLVDATLDYYTEHRTFYQLFQHAIGGSWLNIKAGFDTRNFEEYLQYVALPTQIFRRGAALGAFIGLDADALAAIYTGVLQAYLLHAVIGLDEVPSHAGSSLSRDELHLLLDRTFLAESA